MLEHVFNRQSEDILAGPHNFIITLLGEGLNLEPRYELRLGSVLGCRNEWKSVEVLTKIDRLTYVHACDWVNFPWTKVLKSERNCHISLQHMILKVLP